jgi:membrane-bound lytic murein transglycosylase A
LKKLLILLPLLAAGCGDWFDMPGTRGSGDENVPSNLNKVDFSQVPGWRDDDLRYALKSFKNTCKGRVQYEGRVRPDRELLEEKCRYLPSESADISVVRKWFEDHFQAYRVSDENGGRAGRMTGYYSPTISASRTRQGQFTEPLMGLPKDGRDFKGVDKKTILAQGIGTPLYWAHPVDVQNIQIQGSGVLKLEDGKLVKLNFASTNDVPFNSPGKQLQDRGIRPTNGMAAAAVWEYLKTEPALAREIIDGNPRYVYFAEAGSFDVIGKLGVPLQKIRSIAVDDSIYTLGMPIFIDTTLRDGTKFQRLMVAQDRGEAIKGWVRADIFFGIDAEAEHFASGQNQQGAAFVLLPKRYSGGR